MTAPTSPEQREAEFQRRLGQLREERATDLAEGRQRGQELFGDESLGRLGAGRAPETERLISERRAGLGGLTSQQQTQARERALQGVTEQSQTELSRLRGILGRQGRQLDDPSAVAQQRAILERSLRTRGDVERDLLLSNVALQEQQRQGLENLTRQAQATELGQEQFNIGQIQRERAGQLQTEFGFAGLGSQERFGLRQLQTAEEQQASQAAAQAESFRLQEKTIDKPAPAAPSGGTVICGELYRQGLIDSKVYEGDQAYAGIVNTDVHDGYVTWARPYVRLMQRSKLATKFILPFARNWAQEMAFRTGYVSTGSFIGKVVHNVGSPFCWAIGKVRGLLGYKPYRHEEMI